MILRQRFGDRGAMREFEERKLAMDALIYEEIAARRDAFDLEERDDVLSLLLGARDEDGQPMDDRELRDELVTVLAAGHETTATGLAWAIERLTHNPGVLTKLRDSLAAGEEEYLAATVKETLRARPVLVDVGRKLTAPATIGGHELAAGSFVLAAIAALHYREDAFPDPEAFRPERFLGAKVDNYAWIPFGGGVRRCIGAGFAMMEGVAVLREVFRAVDVTTVGEQHRGDRRNEQQLDDARFGQREIGKNPANERPAVRRCIERRCRAAGAVASRLLPKSHSLSLADIRPK
jgi:cytochrome P450